GSLQTLPTVSQPEDEAEREADSASHAISLGGRATVQRPPSARIARQPQTPQVARGTEYGSPRDIRPGPPPQSCFEDPSAATPAGAPAAFDKFIALSPNGRKTVLAITYRSGSLSRALAALGLRSREPKYADAVREILRWIEETETRKTTGKS